MTGSPLLQCRHVNKYRGKQTLSSRGVSCLHTHWLTEGLGDNTPSLGASFPWRLKPVSFSILYMWAMPEDPVALTLSEGGSSVLKSHTSLGSCSLLAIAPVLVIWPSCLQDSDFGPLSPSAPTWSPVVCSRPHFGVTHMWVSSGPMGNISYQLERNPDWDLGDAWCPSWSKSCLVTCISMNSALFITN